MATSEISETVAVSKRGLWFGVAMAVSFGLVVTTALVPFNRPLFRQFDLGIESNLASLWSGLMLLVAALHAYDGWAGHRHRDRALAFAWLVVAAALAALSLDEVGSLHERVELIEGWPGRILMLVIAGGFAVAMAYAMLVLYRSYTYSASAKLIAVSIALLVTVPVQEYVQDQMTWPGYLDVARIVVEEGTEIVAIVLLFKACLVNTKGYLGLDPKEPYPFFEAIVDLRGVLLISGMVAAVVFAWVGPYLTGVANYSQSGMPSAWLAGAFFFIAALAFARPWLRSGESLGWPTWCLVALSLFACASTVISPEAQVTHVFHALFCALAISLCVLDHKRPLVTYLPAGLAMPIVLIVLWPLKGDHVFDALLVELVAMAFFCIATPLATKRSTAVV